MHFIADSSYKSLPTRCFLDTNVILGYIAKNFCPVPLFQPTSFRAIECLIANQANFVVSERIQQEIIEQIDDACLDKDVRNIVLSFWDYFFAKHNVETISDCKGTNPHKYLKINPADRIWIPAADESESVIVTNDIDLALSCRDAGIKTIFPSDIVVLGKPCEPIPYFVNSPIPIGYLKEDKGAIFISCIFRNLNHTASIFNSGEISLYYEDGFWKIAWCKKEIIKKKIKAKKGEVVKFLINYNAQLRIIELNTSEDAHPAKATINDLFWHNKSNLAFGDGLSLKSKYYETASFDLRTTILCPNTVSRDRFKKICQFEHAIPNPYDEIELAKILKNVFVEKSIAVN